MIRRWVWGEGQQSCVACGGGSIAVGDTCQCPEGTQWDGNQCQQVVVAVPACTGCAFMTDQGCMCPEGTAWDGASCVQAAAAPPQQQVIIRQHTHQQSSSFTCCINGAKYNCPNDAELRACTTLQAHNCTAAGGC